MKRKLEHLAAKLAFEEVDDPQAEKIRRLAAEDAETERAVQEYASMRADLKRLRDRTPEPMLSTDRLRDAILKEGLSKRRSAGSNWSWAWAPVAVGVLAFAFAASRHNRATGLPPVVGPDTSIAMRQDPSIFLPAPSVTPTPTPSVAMSPQPTTRRARLVRHRAKEAVEMPVGDILALLPIIAPQLDAMRARGDQYIRLATTMGTVRKPDFGIVTTTMAKAASDSLGTRAAGAKDERIVIIQPDTDGQTGAQRATEVESSANVSFGG